MIIPKFLAQIDRTRLTEDTPERALSFQEPWSLYKYLQGLKNTVEVIIRIPRSLRTLQQLRLHWVRMTILGKVLGHDKEEMHYVFKKLFLADKYPVLSKDQFIEYLQKIEKDLVTTKNLSTKEMVDFMEKIERQAAELGIYLPSPDEISIDNL